ncbi:hypothetical protein ACOSQ2_004408 [Xanthoceras sorbifolium]
MSLSSCSSTSTYTCTLLNQTMSFSFRLTPLTSPPQTHLRFALVRPKTPLTISASPPRFRNLDLPTIRCVHESSDHRMPVAVTPAKPRWENMLSTAASLYPVYVTVGGVIACLKPSTFAWFVNRAPFSYILSLGLIMLAMGLTLELKDLLGLFRQRPLSILFGCIAQYTIMPAFGVIISKSLGLPPSLSVGLILLSCCPGGTASNVVGMQNSSLGVVLATTHFASSMVALPPAMSAVIMNIMGSSLGFFWRYINPSDLKSSPETVEKLK